MHMGMERMFAIIIDFFVSFIAAAYDYMHYQLIC